MPTSSGQGRERFYWFNNRLQLIPSSRNFQGRFFRGFSGIQYLRALALIYSHSPRVLGNPEWIWSQTEKESESRKESQNASVGRSDGRPTNALVDRSGRPAPTETWLLSVGRRAVDRSHATVDRAVDRSASMHLVHTGWPSDQPAPCIGQPGSRPCTALACCMRRFCSFWFSISMLSSDVSSISSLPTRRSYLITRVSWC